MDGVGEMGFGLGRLDEIVMGLVGVGMGFGWGWD